MRNPNPDPRRSEAARRGWDTRWQREQAHHAWLRSMAEQDRPVTWREWKGAWLHIRRHIFSIPPPPS